ncbi:metallophosphoesterase [Paraburkholderia saeva]|uniref:Bis(5'-nucleosyl)-tetraphosphatase, symmetrical n=1 Tax=Paraburkholderia saeva TaxID=2777537 RepID=A0A9N8RVP3_9BURK|nr:metallophosphoesterase [Paraburkholderia saeva]CAG4886324.1 Bis(5'-nucleosyl)-tetraphosphatase, symmetrical [Paraburkholderia saeva]CAG4893824.1 Bis(5'-nucleosyl)-tetraphosphatase, symmetrical [Paraburkholderia saeva]
MDPVLIHDVWHHSVNRKGRDFIVGDLHGCVDALRYLLREIAFDPARDRLFSVGDLVDRGTQSEEALALLDKPWFYAVLGNHEDTLCAVAEGRLRRHWWYGIGGSWAAPLSDEKLRYYAERLRTLPLVRVVGNGAERFNVLHAEFFGTDDDLDVGEFSDEVRQKLLWGRELALGTGNPLSQRGLSLTYCGHTPMRELQQIGSQVFVDTGAFGPGGKLSIVEARRSHRWSVTVDAARAQGAAAMALP